MNESKDPYWDQAAKQYLTCFISYILKALPKEEHNLYMVSEIMKLMQEGTFDLLIEELRVLDDECNAVTMYDGFKNNKTAERMHQSIMGILSEVLKCFTFTEMHIFFNKKQLDFKAMAEEKTAVFLSVSDTDFSMECLLNAFYTEALHSLVKVDDESPDNRLKIPVRLFLDDFAASSVIKDFDRNISIIRSREISVSIILQSLSQLRSMYGPDKAATIINNCDHWLYLGGQDIETVTLFSKSINVMSARVMHIPLKHAYLCERGAKPRLVKQSEPIIVESNKIAS